LKERIVLNKKRASISFVLIILLAFISISTLPVHAAATVSLGASARTETTITLSWSKSSDSLFSKYELYMSNVGTNGPYNLTWSTTTESQTSAYIYNLSPNTNYWFYIRDTDWLGSANSNTFQTSTSDKPTISITSRTTTTVSLQWNDYNTYSSLVPFSSYVIYVSTNGGSWSTLTTITDASQNTYTVTGLSPATYAFFMQDNAGTSGQYSSSSNAANVVIHNPVQVQISSSTSSVNAGQQVQLTASASGGTNSYNYQWFSNGNPIPGATYASYTYFPSDTGTINIYATAQDAGDSLLSLATSNSITLTVTATPTPQPHNSIDYTLTQPTPTVPELTSSFVLLFLAIIAACSFIVLKVKKQNK
jgi:hypothetical protein